MPEVDIVIYGATGFTGRQAAVLLDAIAPAEVRLGLAGRRADALEKVAGSLTRDVVCMVADSHEPSTVDAMVQRARVVLTTAGPYSRYGTPVVEACVRHGVDYVDITGETPWVYDMITAHHETAKAKGLRIVPFCGFDSVPSDLGVFVAEAWARENWGCGLKEDQAVFSAKGGFNGGTLASALTMSEMGRNRELAQPFLLDGPREVSREEKRANFDVRSPVYLEPHGGWVAPFFMAPINTRVVRRSASLRAAAGAPIGEGFRYQEYMSVGRSRLAALTMTAGLGLFAGLMQFGWGRSLFQRLGPRPGQGPSEAAMDGGFTRAVHYATAENGKHLKMVLSSPGDPGNRVTVRFLCECALALVLNREELPAAAGLLTPSTAFGEVLVRRLREAGMTLEVTPEV